MSESIKELAKAMDNLRMKSRIPASAVDDERQGIGGRRGNHADQGPAPPTRPTQDGRSVKRQASIQNGSPEYHTISSDLVGWVNTWSEEQELSASGLEDHLLALARI
ncbi:hypothetical protein [Acaryochloris sp. CCMEE 5410]|uniref:hypothetical protein n=1 Tax=Acaryochloris sp. CCMEE 5410 TaxID=310037 RepID=UPI0021CEDACC|nr:hypothetical protein [Acaryochloris sp. CCMEE 5410]